jgi:hypothetical protein
MIKFLAKPTNDPSPLLPPGLLGQSIAWSIKHNSWRCPAPRSNNRKTKTTTEILEKIVDHQKLC